MPSNRQLEGSLKREITRIYKSMFGTGPDKITIRIIDDVICCKMEGAFSVLEQSLIQTEEGVDLVKKIREQIDLQKRSENIQYFESMMNDKLETIEYSVNFDRQTAYLFIVMKNHIVIQS